MHKAMKALQDRRGADLAVARAEGRDEREEELRLELSEASLKVGGGWECAGEGRRVTCPPGCDHTWSVWAAPIPPSSPHLSCTHSSTLPPPPGPLPRPPLPAPSTPLPLGLSLTHHCLFRPRRRRTTSRTK